MSMSQAAFLSAVKSGDVHTVRRLLEQGGIDVNARNHNDHYGRTPIFYANNVDIMWVLIVSGAQVNFKDGDGWTPLHEKACERGRENEACCELLLSNNADIEAQAYSGHTPLDLAAYYEQLEVVRLMLAHQRSRHGHEGVSSLLAKTGTVPRLNALHYAVYHSSAKTARLLVEQCRGEDGVLVSACHQMMVDKDTQGRTPLDLARNSNNTEVVEYLSSFQVLTLATPAAASSDVAVMLNPCLDEYQHAIAAECGESIRTTCCATEVPDVVVYIVLGYLSPLDVMKR